MDKPLVIVQARLGSKRFPRKILADIGGIPLISLMLQRLCRDGHFFRIIVSLPAVDSGDKELQEALNGREVFFWDGPEQDVLGRFLATAEHYHHTGRIIRLTADCPLIDPKIVWKMRNLSKSTFVEDGAFSDVYLSNTVIRTYPDGQDVELFSYSGLQILDNGTKDLAQREHVTWRAPVLLDHRPVLSEEPWTARLKMSVDTRFDLEVVRGLVERNGALANYWGYASDLVRTPIRLVSPQGTQTLSKTPTKKSPVASGGRGSHLLVHGGKGPLLDWTMALGAVILGYGREDILRAEQNALRAYGGHSFSFPTEMEGVAAEAILKHTPHADMVRFFKNGSDGVAGACRLARAYTGRQEIHTWGYHGWHDPFVPGLLRKVEGLDRPPNTFIMPKLSSESIFCREKVAAIICEPSCASAEELWILKEYLRDTGALLIIDEVLTGFRHRLGEMIPGLGDITVYGKCLANGAPLSAICARKEIMELAGACHLSSTFGGEIDALAACAATIGLLEIQDYEDKNYIGRVLKHHFLAMTGPDSRPVLSFGTDETRSFFASECLERGIISIGIHNISFSHTMADVEKTIEVYEEFYRKVLA